MKAKNYFLLALLLFFTNLFVSAQSGMTIHSGGAVTVNGNLTITPDPNACGNPITDSRDGKSYNTVQIGTQCWMAQNLNIGTKIPGSAEQISNGIIEKYCYNNDEANCDVYGGLYQWAEIVQYINGATNATSWNPIPTGNIQGICPLGWHVPTDAEWTMLMTYLGGTGLAGGKLKETGYAHWASPNTGATNSSGFTAFAGGYKHTSGSFYSLSYTAFFWSLTQYSASTAGNKALGYTTEGVFTSAQGLKTEGFSVRCIKD